MIPRPPHALFAVFDGFRRAAADACHAVGAVAAPDGPAILDGDVVGRAELDALTATGADITGRERLRFDTDGIENRIYRAAHETVVEVVTG